MRKSYWTVGLGLLALGVGLYAWKPSHRELAGSEIEAIEALRTEVAQLREELVAEQAQRKRAVSELEGLIRGSARDPRGPTGANAAVDPGVAAVMIDHGAEREAEPAELIELVDPGEHIASVFAQQGSDPEWAATSEDVIERKLSAQLPSSSTVRSVECHATLCRVETLHRDAAAYGQFVADTFKDPSKRIWASDAFSEEQAGSREGAVVVVSYLAREGETLPSTH